MTITAEDLLKVKGYDLWSVPPNSSVYEALEILCAKNVGALLVFDSGPLIGIFSERDYARKLVLKGKFSKDTQVREVMTDKVVTVAPEENIERCMEIMTREKIRHLPVEKDSKVIGLISIGDIVKAIISDQKFTIGVLNEYITGGR